MNRPHFAIVFLVLIFCSQSMANSPFESFVGSTLRLGEFLSSQDESIAIDQNPNISAAMDLLEEPLRFRCIDKPGKKYPGVSFQYPYPNSQGHLLVSSAPSQLSTLLEAKVSWTSGQETIEISNFKQSLNSNRHVVTAPLSAMQDEDWTLLYRDFPVTATIPIEPKIEPKMIQQFKNKDGELIDSALLKQLVGEADHCISYIPSFIMSSFEEGYINGTIFETEVNCDPKNFSDCLAKTLMKCDSSEYATATKEARHQIRQAYNESEKYAYLWDSWVSLARDTDMESFCRGYAAILPGTLSTQSIRRALEATPMTDLPAQRYCYERPARILKSLNIDLERTESEMDRHQANLKRYEEQKNQYEQEIEIRRKVFLNIKEFTKASTLCCRDELCSEKYQTELLFK